MVRRLSCPGLPPRSRKCPYLHQLHRISLAGKQHRPRPALPRASIDPFALQLESLRPRRSSPPQLERQLARPERPLLLDSPPGSNRPKNDPTLPPPPHTPPP